MLGSWIITDWILGSNTQPHTHISKWLVLQIQNIRERERGRDKIAMYIYLFRWMTWFLSFEMFTCISLLFVLYRTVHLQSMYYVVLCAYFMASCVGVRFGVCVYIYMYEGTCMCLSVILNAVCSSLFCFVLLELWNGLHGCICYINVLIVCVCVFACVLQEWG